MYKCLSKIGFSIPITTKYQFTYQNVVYNIKAIRVDSIDYLYLTSDKLNMLEGNLLVKNRNHAFIVKMQEFK